ncbi:protein kinase family protein [Hamadaea tsunoensis]|uniref:hypothetical protein n=1 Tax=Hamadaea tsunoensis TaxID=53368 RepID=UPI000688C282|nr:hypothetical protein [Hamadaea tsunoensis]
MSIGTWQETSTADGRKVGALALPQQTQDQLTRVVAAVNAVRRLNLPGVVPIADLVGHQGRAWLVTPNPVGPTLQTLAGRLTPGGVATVLSDTGQTLMKLHAAGITHGALDASTIVLSSGGVAMLSEVGMATAAAGRTGSAQEDTAAWADLARRLGGSDPTIAAVAAAAAAGLETGLKVLAAHAGSLPGFGDRATLAALPQTPAPVRTDVPPAESTTLLPGQAGVAMSGQATTPEPAYQPGAFAVPAAPAAAPVPAEDAATQMARRSTAQPVAAPAPVQRAADGALRFGQGPVATPATPTWTPPPPVKPKKSTFKRVTGFLSGLITVVLVVIAALVLWQKFHNPVVLSGVTIGDVAVGKCDSQADVIATVVTNGKAGTFTYEWTDSDGHQSGRLNQSVRDGQGSVQVHYYWGFAGKGKHDGTATINIISPGKYTATGKVAYSCK